MPRTQIPLTQITRAGVTPPAQTDSDNTNGNYIDPGNSNNVFVEIVSTEVSASRTVGFAFNTDLATVDGVAVPDKTVTIPHGETRIVGPLTRDLYRQSADGYIYVNPSVNTTLKFRAYTT